MSEKKITKTQYFSLLYLSLLSSLFMYLSSSKINIASTDAILRPVVFIFLSILFSVPAFLIQKEHDKLKNNRQYMPVKRPFKIIALIYAVVYFISLVKATARFDLFVSTELFPNSDMTIFLGAMLACCVTISFLGIGALARAAGGFLLLVIISTVVVMFSLANEVDILNFTPVFQNGALSFIEECLIFTMQATEIGTLIMFLPEIKGDIRKKFGVWAVAAGLSFSLILFFVVGSLGAFADTQLFPTYASVTIASFGLLERIDALETAIWVLCVVGKISFYFLVVTKALNYTFPKISKKIWGVICGISATVIISFISLNINRFYFLSSEVLTVALFTLAAVVLPIFAFITMKKVAPCEKIEENI